jgi:MFS family permease
MEVLDTSIANVALPYMAGSLGASTDESTWVLTSYLVSNAIVLPISGWFAGVFGRKRFFMICLTIFTASSMLCGTAPSLGAIILFRVMQGAGGGGLQPMAQAILADTFPPQKRGLAFALYGITTIIAPTIGPTLGGWITDHYTWRWIFFINLPVGVLALFLVFRLVDDAFHVFVYAPFQERVRRLRTTGVSEKEAVELAETVDRDRADFAKRYFDVDWPGRHRFHLMVNSGVGDDLAVEIVLDAVAKYAERRT